MKTIKKIVAVFLLATVIFTLSGCSWFMSEPEKEAQDFVKESISNLYNVTSGNYELSLKGVASGAPNAVPQNLNFNLSMAGLFDSKDSKAPQFTMKLAGDMAADQDTKQAIDIELRLNKENFYVLLTQLPDFGETVPKEAIALFTGKWWQIAIPEGAFEQMSLLEQDETKMTPEQKAFKELFNKTKFFKDLKFIAGDSLSGVDCYHYSGVLDKDGIKTFLAEASKLQGQEMTETDLQNLDSFLAATTAPVDLWIDSSTATLKKFASKLTIVPQNAGYADIKLSFELKNVNEDVSVEIPANATIFDPASLFGGMTIDGTGTTDALNTAEITDAPVINGAGGQ